MKTIKQIFVVGAIVGVASAAHAAYTVTMTDGGVAVKTGASYVAVTPTVINTTTPNSSTPAPYHNYYVGSTFPTEISGQSTYDITVTHVPGSSTLEGYLNFSLNYALEGSDYSNDALGTLFNVQSISVAGLTTSYGGGNSWTSTDKPTAGQQYVLTVDWTLSGVYNQYPNWLSSFDIQTVGGLTSGGTASVPSDVFITAVPEPGQAIAGVTLLGCGGLIFIGRRFMVKKA